MYGHLPLTSIDMFFLSITYQNDNAQVNFLVRESVLLAKASVGFSTIYILLKHSALATAFKTLTLGSQVSVLFVMRPQSIY